MLNPVESCLLTLLGKTVLSKKWNKYFIIRKISRHPTSSGPENRVWAPCVLQNSPHLGIHDVTIHYSMSSLTSSPRCWVSSWPPPSPSSASWTQTASCRRHISVSWSMNTSWWAHSIFIFFKAHEKYFKILMWVQSESHAWIIFFRTRLDNLILV